ncbi:MAG TPA: ATP-binding protein [Gemmatimonadaceae bacterium]|jgi:signal transduction histidine kinase
MTFQRKLLFGFSLMVIPALLIGAEAIRTNLQERRALQALGENMARTRVYAELETAMFNETQVIWRYLSGMDSTARDDFRVNGQVVTYWQAQWRSALRPGEAELADGVDTIQGQIEAVAQQVFALYDSGQHAAAYRMAQTQIRDRLAPALTEVNRDVYRRARESSVRGAYARLESILAAEDRVLIALFILAVGTGLLASWLIARGLARPIRELGEAMAIVGAGELEHPIAVSSHDEVGELAHAFARMTAKLRQSRADMVRLNSELEGKIAQLQQTQRQLVHAERLASIGELSAAVAHGLRNPLASLRAAAQVALRRTNAGDSREHLEAIIYESDRLDRRITHLLDFSRPAPFHPLGDTVSRIVDDVLPGFRELLGERHVELEVDVAPNLPEVRVDPMQLEQALVEIISNALDAMPDGGRLRIAARVETADAAADRVVIDIADTGVGIPEAILASVCEPFFTTRPTGTGLGLATAKRYVEQNGGQLEIVSTTGAGGGTSVRVRLPAAPDHLTPNAASESAPADVAARSR